MGRLPLALALALLALVAAAHAAPIRCDHEAGVYAFNSIEEFCPAVRGLTEGVLLSPPGLPSYRATVLQDYWIYQYGNYQLDEANSKLSFEVVVENAVEEPSTKDVWFDDEGTPWFSASAKCFIENETDAYSGVVSVNITFGDPDAASGVWHIFSSLLDISSYDFMIIHLKPLESLDQYVQVLITNATSGNVSVDTRMFAGWALHSTDLNAHVGEWTTIVLPLRSPSEWSGDYLKNVKKIIIRTMGGVSYNQTILVDRIVLAKADWSYFEVFVPDCGWVSDIECYNATSGSWLSVWGNPGKVMPLSDGTLLFSEIYGASEGLAVSKPALRGHNITEYMWGTAGSPSLVNASSQYGSRYRQVIAVKLPPWSDYYDINKVKLRITISYVPGALGGEEKLVLRKTAYIEPNDVVAPHLVDLWASGLTSSYIKGAASLMGDNFTLMIHWHPTGYTDPNQGFVPIISKYSHNNYGFILCTQASTNRLVFQVHRSGGLAGGVFVDGLSGYFGKWMHVTARHELNTTIGILIDATVMKERTPSGYTRPDGDVAFGYFNVKASVAYAAIFNHSLSDGEVAEVYSSHLVSQRDVICLLDPTFHNGTHFIDLSGHEAHMEDAGFIRVPAAEPFLWLLKGLEDDNKVHFKWFPVGSKVTIKEAGSGDVVASFIIDSDDVAMDLPAGNYTVEVELDALELGRGVVYEGDLSDPSFTGLVSGLFHEEGHYTVRAAPSMPPPDGLEVSFIGSPGVNYTFRFHGAPSTMVRHIYVNGSGPIYSAVVPVSLVEGASRAVVDVYMGEGRPIVWDAYGNLTRAAYVDGDLVVALRAARGSTVNLTVYVPRLGMPRAVIVYGEAVSDLEAEASVEGYRSSPPPCWHYDAGARALYVKAVARSEVPITVTWDPPSVAGHVSTPAEVEEGEVVQAMLTVDAEYSFLAKIVAEVWRGWAKVGEVEVDTILPAGESTYQLTLGSYPPGSYEVSVYVVDVKSGAQYALPAATFTVAGAAAAPPWWLPMAAAAVAAAAAAAYAAYRRYWW